MARPGSDVSERLVRAARDRFLEEGVDGASLRAIARDAGTSLGMVYYYFPAKDDLFFAVIEEVYAELVGKLENVLAADLSSEAKIHAMYQVLAALSDDDLKVVRLIVKEGLSSSQRLSKIFERFSRGHVPLLLGMIFEGVQKGELRGDVPPIALVVSTLAVGLLPQLVARRLREAGVPAAGLFPPAPELATVLAEVALRGLSVVKLSDGEPSELTPSRERRK